MHSTTLLQYKQLSGIYLNTCKVSVLSQTLNSFITVYLKKKKTKTSLRALFHKHCDKMFYASIFNSKWDISKKVYNVMFEIKVDFFYFSTHFQM